MKLFIAGMFNSIQPTYDFVVAENKEEAIKKIGEKLNLPYLPHEAKEIKVDGFDIVLEPKAKAKTKKDT